MRTITVTLSAAGQPVPVVDAEPAFVPFEEWDGHPLKGVQLHEIERRGEIELQLVRIAAGGRFAMHASPKLAFCHVVQGGGALGFPDGSSVQYRGPETFVFHPGTLHDWHDVTEDTLLAVAIVPDGS